MCREDDDLMGRPAEFSPFRNSCVWKTYPGRTSSSTLWYSFLAEVSMRSPCTTGYPSGAPYTGPGLQAKAVTHKSATAAVPNSLTENLSTSTILRQTANLSQFCEFYPILLNNIGPRSCFVEKMTIFAPDQDTWRDLAACNHFKKC